MPPESSAAASAVPSPCINLCRMDPHSGCCEGCWRSLEEIARWGGASDDAKRAVLAAVDRRRAAAGQLPDA